MTWLPPSPWARRRHLFVEVVDQPQNTRVTPRYNLFRVPWANIKSNSKPHHLHITPSRPANRLTCFVFFSSAVHKQPADHNNTTHFFPPSNRGPGPGCFLLSIISFFSSGIFMLHSHSGVANRARSLLLSSVRSRTHVAGSIGVIFHVAAEDPEFCSSSTRPSRLAFL